MLKSGLCDYSDAYVLVKGIMTIAGAGNADQTDKQTEEIMEENLKMYGIRLLRKRSK